MFRSRFLIVIFLMLYEFEKVNPKLISKKAHSSQISRVRVENPVTSESQTRIQPIIIINHVSRPEDEKGDEEGNSISEDSSRKRSNHNCRKSSVHYPVRAFVPTHSLYKDNKDEELDDYEAYGADTEASSERERTDNSPTDERPGFRLVFADSPHSPERPQAPPPPPAPPRPPRPPLPNTEGEESDEEEPRKGKRLTILWLGYEKE